MTVIPFPRSKLRGQPALPDLLYSLIAALRSLGEPATAGEILELLQVLSEVGDDVSEDSLIEVMDRHRERGAPGLGDDPVFRCVVLDGAAAWAFTPAFRTRLHCAGMPAVLRGACDTRAVGPSQSMPPDRPSSA